MGKIIYIKYGELTLKGKNRNDFSLIAYENLKKALKKFDLVIKKNFDNIIIAKFKDDEINAIIDICKKIPGFCNLTIAYVINKDIETLKKTILDLIDNQEKTFKINCKRKDKKFNLNSDEIIRLIATEILKHKPLLKVNIHHPDIKINIEINDQIYIYFKKILCAGGLPIGSSGKVLMLLSGGIDSIVSSYLLMKRGMHVDFITFITPPHTSEKALQKVRNLTRIVTMDGILENCKLYVCNFTKVQDELAHVTKESYRITLLRRSFFRISAKLAKEKGYDAIATGESLGQVASQTIESMNVISSAIDFLVLRPLLAYDKNEIINLAKMLDTYNVSILPYDDSCSLFAPKNPITKPKKEIVIDLEQKLDFLYSIEQLVYNNIIKEDINDY